MLNFEADHLGNDAEVDCSIMRSIHSVEWDRLPSVDSVRPGLYRIMGVAEIPEGVVLTLRVYRRIRKQTKVGYAKGAGREGCLQMLADKPCEVTCKYDRDPSKLPDSYKKVFDDGRCVLVKVRLGMPAELTLYQPAIVWLGAKAMQAERLAA